MWKLPIASHILSHHLFLLTHFLSSLILLTGTEEKLDFFMLTDRGGLVSKKYGSSLSIPGFGTFSNRQTYIIDPKGELKWIFTDVESRIARHSAEVLDKLKELEQQTA